MSICSSRALSTAQGHDNLKTMDSLKTLRLLKDSFTSSEDVCGLLYGLQVSMVLSKRRLYDDLVRTTTACLKTLGLFMDTLKFNGRLWAVLKTSRYVYMFS